MTRSYTPSKIADGILAGEFTRESEFVSKLDVERLREALQTIRDQGGDVVERWSSEVARKALEGNQ